MAERARVEAPLTEEGGPARAPATPAEAQGGPRLGPAAGGSAGARLLGGAPDVVLRFEAARRDYLEARHALNTHVLTEAERGTPAAGAVTMTEAARYRALRRRARLHVGDDGRLTLVVPLTGPALGDPHEAPTYARLDRLVDRLAQADLRAWTDVRSGAEPPLGQPADGASA